MLTGNLIPRCAKCERPEVSAKFHGLSCQQRFSGANDEGSGSSAVRLLKNEVATLTADLGRARMTISELKRSRRYQMNVKCLLQCAVLDWKCRFSGSDCCGETLGLGPIYDISKGDRRPAGLVRQFGDLYSITR